MSLMQHLRIADAVFTTCSPLRASYDWATSPENDRHRGVQLFRVEAAERLAQRIAEAYSPIALDC